MKTLFTTISHKLSEAIKAHFDKNPNDVIALSFGAFVLVFILLITPHIPQNTSSNLAEKPVLEQDYELEIKTEQKEQTIINKEKAVLKATLR